MGSSVIVNKEEELAKICEFHNIKNSDFNLDGLTPEKVVLPSSTDEVAKVLKLAKDTKTSLAIIGNGTKFNYGAPLKKLDWVLKTTSLVEEPVIDTNDLIVFAKSGVSLPSLQNQLQEKNLFLPVDIGNVDTTVGGLLGIGSGSSHRLGYGLIKDFVLGLNVALTDGNIYKFGGITVKNVAGYDLAKLFIGSRGTLGVITDVCFRIYALPPSSKVFLGLVKNKEDVFNIVKSLNKLLPTVLEVYDLSKAKDIFNLTSTTSGYALLVKFTGPTPAVNKNYEEALEIFKNKDYSLIDTKDVDDKKIWKNRAQYFEKNISNKKEPVVTRIKVLMPSKMVFEVTNKVESILKDNNVIAEKLYLPYVGLAYYNISHEISHKLLEDIKEEIALLRSFLVLEEGPLNLRSSFYQDPRKLWDKNIKEFFDPYDILNPGKRP